MPAIAKPAKMPAHEQMDIVCEHIAAGESLRTVCSRPDSPSMATVMRWLADEKNGAMREQYARACEERGSALAEASLEEARKALGLDASGVAAQRLIVDTLKWHASKLNAKKYGDKLSVGGADDLPSISHKAEITLSPDEAFMRMIGKA